MPANDHENHEDDDENRQQFEVELAKVAGAFAFVTVGSRHEFP